MSTTRNTTMQRILILLEDGKPRSCPEIAADLGIGGNNTASTVKLMKEINRVHVSSYRYNGMKKPVKLWTIGAGRDANKPRCPTKNQRTAMARAKARAAADAIGRNVLMTVTPFRHVYDTWLFGEYAKPFTPQIQSGRIFRQSMDVDELEAA